MRLTGGNVAVRGAPSAWLNTWTAMHIGGTGSLAGIITPAVGGAAELANNLYLDNAGWKYIVADYGSMFEQYNGAFTFYGAVAGGAPGAAATLLTRMTISNTGLVGIGRTSTTHLLEVNGNIFANGGGGSGQYGQIHLYDFQTNYTNRIDCIHGSLSFYTGTGPTLGMTLDLTQNLTVAGGFGCNGASAQSAYASGGAVYPGFGTVGAASSADWTAFVTLVANMRTALVNNGIMS
jgi:hypothetical protein